MVQSYQPHCIYSDYFVESARVRYLFTTSEVSEEEVHDSENERVNLRTAV